MFNGNEYFAEENAAVDEDYAKLRNALTDARNSTRDSQDPWSTFVHRSTDFLTRLADLEARQGDNQIPSLDEFAAEHEAIFETFVPGNYAQSFANPAYAAELLGAEVGPLASLVSAGFWQELLIGAALRRQRFTLAGSFRRFLDIAALGEGATVSAEGLREILMRHAREDRTFELDVDIRRRFDPACSLMRDIAVTAEPGDLRTLYQYGWRVTEHDFRTARFISELPQEKVERIADAVLAGYLRGFEIDRKDISAKSTAMVIGRPGYERIVKRLFAGLEGEGLATCYLVAPSIKLNRQFNYDHRFDYAVTLDSELVEARVTEMRTVLDRRSGLLRALSGNITFEVFGEQPFSPELKDACLTADKEAAALNRELSGRRAQLWNAASPSDEQSFTIVSFPSPEIRGNFAAIFADTLEVNMLENARYEHIQHDIIAALDRAESVRVTGREGNRTDLRVMLPPLTDPATQTNFVNCVADRNIPLGEVFTSPRLTGTSGVLHVEEAFLQGLRFRDLELTFEDGCITDYGCGNFEDDAANKKYVHENLIYPHESLPIGEFAIGTNTLAYAMAKRHGIMDVLPVLIIEKMGPHFAVGDTCFSWQEDHVARNPLDGKEVVARENERSRQRTEDPSKAYTNTHIDITLPYSSLDTIAAVMPSGEEIAVIRGGRFVLPGTEGLNAAIEEVDG